MQNEMWKDIKGYRGKYQISDKGRVFSQKKNMFLKTKINGNRYSQVFLSLDGKPTRHRVHRLVAEHFILNMYNLPFINHIDKNKHNNDVKNLEWISPKGNLWHSKGITETHCKNGHEFTKRNTLTYNKVRLCRICRNLWQNEHRKTLKERLK